MSLTIKPVSQNDINYSRVLKKNSAPDISFAANNKYSYTSVKEDFTYNTQKNMIAKADSLNQEFKQIKKEQGITGRVWSGVKNLFNFKTGSKNVKDKIRQFQNGEISYKEAKNAIDKYSKGQKMAVDVAGDVASGMAGIGVFALIAPTGGLSLAVALGAAALGGSVAKVAAKKLDSITGGRQYETLPYDCVTGSINGLLGPVTNGIGNMVTKTVGEKLGLSFAKQGVQSVAKDGISGSIKNMFASQGAKKIEASFFKKLFAKGAGKAVKQGAKHGFAQILRSAFLNSATNFIGNSTLAALLSTAPGAAISGGIVGVSNKKSD